MVRVQENIPKTESERRESMLKATMKTMISLGPPANIDELNSLMVLVRSTMYESMIEAGLDEGQELEALVSVAAQCPERRSAIIALATRQVTDGR